MNEKMGLSIVIPTYNEEGIIEEVIKNADDNAKKFFKNYEIIALDDCSTDNNRAVLKKLTKKFDKLKLIFHRKNTGYGGSLLDLYAAAKGDYILNIPGDNQIPSSNLRRFLKYKDKYGVIIGYRKDRKDGIFRKVQSYVYNLLLSILALMRIHDINSAKLIKNEIVKNIKLETEGAKMEPSAEICLKAVIDGYKIKEIVIEHRERTYGKNSAGSTKSVFNIPFIVARDIFNLWRVIKRYKRIRKNANKTH